VEVELVDEEREEEEEGLLTSISIIMMGRVRSLVVRAGCFSTADGFSASGLRSRKTKFFFPFSELAF